MSLKNIVIISLRYLFVIILQHTTCMGTVVGAGVVVAVPLAAAAQNFAAVVAAEGARQG